MSASTPISVLIVDDNPDHRALLVRAMKRSPGGVEVATASTGDDLLRSLDMVQTLDIGAFDCIVLDFNLADIKADALLGAIRARTANCPVIVVSSSTEQYIAVQTFRHGGLDFIPKNEAIKGDRLWRRVNDAIDHARCQQAERRQRERRERDLTEAAHLDPLTGLANRRFFDDALASGRWVRDRRQKLACVTLDLDHFKQINDAYGHSVGDDVLRAVAEAIDRQVRNPDLAVRWGGEEFVVVRHSASLTDAWLWAERLRTRIARIKVKTGGEVIQPTASIGFARVGGSELGIDTIREADQAMYLAKQSGRNRVSPAELVRVQHMARKLADGQFTIDGRRRELLRWLDRTVLPVTADHVGGHCQQVSAVAVEIGQRMGLSPVQLREVEEVGLLHDIGKCVLPEELLAKPWPLSFEERCIMNQHAPIGELIARELGADDVVCRSVGLHHARANDDRRDGQDTPLAARIVCVADAVVTMISPRPYCAARSIDDARAELRANAGTQFDAEVVQAACRSTSRPVLAAA